MLQFFQKYQRFFFICVTVGVIGSFAFFGAFETLTQFSSVKKEDRTLGKAIDGSPMMLSRIAALSKLIGKEREENLCNDGVLQKDFFDTGLYAILASAYFDVLQKGLNQKLAKIKKYRGYENPEASFLSARFVWERFAPSLKEMVEEVQKQETASIDTLSSLVSLHRKQAECPPEFIRRALFYFQSQFSWVKPDPYLPHADFSLFGFHSLQDWFGADFIDLSAEFIFNVARIAEGKGYFVSLDEAKGDMLVHFQQGLEVLQAKNSEIRFSMEEQFRMLGLEAEEAVKAWQDVLLFRRYFSEVGGSAFCDSLSYKDLASFAKESFLVQKYGWHESLHLKTFQDFVDFQIYLGAISGISNTLALPKKILPLERIAEKTPDLIHTDYLVKIAQKSLEEISLRATLKEVLDWELEKDSFAALRLKFPSLAAANNKEERYRALEKLSSDERLSVDLYARLAIAKLHPEWISQALKESALPSQEIFVSQNWISLPNLTQASQLGFWLNLASQGDAEAIQYLSQYSEDGMLFTSFQEVEKLQEAHVITWQEAKARNVLSLVSDAELKKEYAKKNETRLFSSVKEELATSYFAPLMRKMAKENMPLEYYAHHRLEVPAKEALAHLQNGSSEDVFLGNADNPLLDQFKLVKTDCSLQRTTKDEWMKDQVLIMIPKKWSGVHVPANGDVTFFYFDQKKSYDEPILEQIVLGQEAIASDAKRYVAEGLVTQMKEKQAITLPFGKEVE